MTFGWLGVVNLALATYDISNRQWICRAVILPEVQEELSCFLFYLFCFVLFHLEQHQLCRSRISSVVHIDHFPLILSYFLSHLIFLYLLLL